MLRLIFVAIICSVTYGHTVTNGSLASEKVGAWNGYIGSPSLYPYAPGRNQLLPNYPYNYPYYNQAVGPAVPIVSYSNNRGIDGSYSYSYASADGKQTQERGFLKNAYIDKVGNPQGAQVAEGSYAYVSPEGIPIQVSYIADEFGFRPSGVNIPADGKSVLPTIINGVNNGFADPVYNRIYSSLNYGNKYNNYGLYNPLNPNQSRYPYDSSKYPLYNPYKSIEYNKDTVVKHD